MKSLFFALIFVSFTTVSMAQKSFILYYQPKKAFVSVSGGVSLPMGDFACRLASNKESGLAQQGSTVNFAAGYRIAGVLGLMGRYQQQSNQMDANALLALPYIKQADKRVATAGQWTMSTIMFGPYVSLPSGRFSFDIRALAGPATAVCPTNGLEGTLGDVPIMSINTSQGQASAKAFGGGLTVSYRLGRSLAAHINSDYSTARFNFTGMTTTTQEGTRVQTIAVGGQKVISVLNVSAGITFLFANRNRPF